MVHSERLSGFFLYWKVGADTLYLNTPLRGLGISRNTNEKKHLVFNVVLDDDDPVLWIYVTPSDLGSHRPRLSVVKSAVSVPPVPMILSVVLVSLLVLSDSLHTVTDQLVLQRCSLHLPVSCFKNELNIFPLLRYSSSTFRLNLVLLSQYARK